MTGNFIPQLMQYNSFSLSILGTPHLIQYLIESWALTRSDGKEKGRLVRSFLNKSLINKSFLDIIFGDD
ncbi:MAG: hypothetical protein ACFE95_20710 [Candidatus Hodarchaeota archaeon]